MAQNTRRQVEKEEEDTIYSIMGIVDAQRSDPKLKKLFERPDKRRRIKPVRIDNETILVKTSKSNRIRFVIPDSLQDNVLNWYHHYLQHPGSGSYGGNVKCNHVVARHAYPKIKDLCRKCDRCQKGKKRKRSYAHLPPKKQSLDLGIPYVLIS